jgi:uncharacterized protein YoxC
VNWELVSLATIAVMMIVMTVTQVAVLLRIARLAQQAANATEELRRELHPLLAKAHRIADDAARATSLAAGQVERLDRLITTTADRVDDMMQTIHSAVVEPLKHGSFVGTVLRAVLAVFAKRRGPGQPSREDEDGMFVG